MKRDGPLRVAMFTGPERCGIAHYTAGLVHAMPSGIEVQVIRGSFNPQPPGQHAALGARATNGVLLLVAPGDRQLEIVTGKESSRRLSDRSCALAALSMTTAFSGGDLVGGIVTGVRMLSESAGRELQTR